MDSKRSRVELIRERYRKLILEPRRRLEYALLEEPEEAVMFDGGELAGKYAGLLDTDEEDG